jgi:hypothetical protein
MLRWRLKMLKPALRFIPKLAAPKRIEEIPAYLARARTESEKRLADYLAQIKEVCDAVRPGETPGIPKFLQRKRPEDGDRKAQQVIDLYPMHCSCPNDPGAPALCETAFEDRRKL